MKKLSCGFIIVDKKTGLYLGCIPNKKQNDLCDLPKGAVEPDESHLCCAMRELREETGIVLPTESDNAIGFMFEDLGVVPYLKDKDLHLFLTEYDVNVDELKCVSMFDWYGKMIPEMCGYKLGTIDIFTKNIQRAINKALLNKHV